MATECVQDCGDDSYVLAIDDITWTPGTPVPGDELRWEMISTLREPVDLRNVVVDMTVKLGLITLIRSTRSLPDTLAMMGAELEGGLDAPAGEWKQTWTFKLPREIPPAAFRVDLRAETEEEKDFACLNIRVDFGKRP